MTAIKFDTDLEMKTSQREESTQALLFSSRPSSKYIRSLTLNSSTQSVLVSHIKTITNLYDVTLKEFYSTFSTTAALTCICGTVSLWIKVSVK